MPAASTCPGLLGEAGRETMSGEPTRIIPCSCCGGDGGGYEGGNERWIRCTACDGKGEFETELDPITMEDLDHV
jgi:hypothetical protein